MFIGELAERSGFRAKTLRYYDEIGLLRPARRHPVSGYREYGAEALDLLNLVRAAKVAGLDLGKIGRIVAAARRGRACSAVIPLLDDRIRQIDRAIRALRRLKARLRKARRRKGGRTCPILEGLA